MANMANMTDEEKKKREKEVKEQLMIALALLLYPNVDESTVESMPVDVKATLSKKIDAWKGDSNDLSKLSKSDILKVAQDIADIKASYFKVVTVGDAKTCDKCKRWDGKIISDEDDTYPSYADLEASGALHYNCRCYLKPTKISKENISMNTETTEKLEEMAMNAEPLRDTIVYRGFVDESLDTNITYDFGETLVMITPIGEFTGSTVDGKPVKEIVDEESVKMMAEQTEEILLDKDHGSMRSTDRDSSAAGWISGLKAITNLGDMSGLYAIVKWTSDGIRLVKDRIYRFLSPVFELDATGKATKLINVGLTNRPAIKMMPIINSKADDEEKTVAITETIEDKKEEVMEEIKEEVKNEEQIEKAVEETVEETVEESISEESISEESAPEEKKDEVQEEEKTEEKEVQEVIKEEVLNSAPIIGTDISGDEEWRKLKGPEFFAWLKKNGKNYK